MPVEMSLNLSHSINVFIVNHDPQAEPDSWPFLTPVSKEEVPDYYDVIKVRGVESGAGMYGELCLFCGTPAEGQYYCLTPWMAAQRPLGTSVCPTPCFLEFA